MAHEALLTHWDRLRGWIDERREDLLLHRRLAEAATEWEGSGKEPSYLLGGGRLEQFETLAATSDLALSGDERDLIETSRIADDEQRTKRRRRRQGILAGFGAAALVSLAAAGVAFTNQQRAADEAERATQEQARAEQEAGRAEDEAARAEGETARADREAREATGRELAGESILALEEDPELAILVGLEAAEVTRAVGEPVLPEAMSALHRAVQTSRLEMAVEVGEEFDCGEPRRSLGGDHHLRLGGGDRRTGCVNGGRAVEADRAQENSAVGRGSQPRRTIGGSQLRPSHR